MMNNDPFEDELDAIRIKLYEQTKDMTATERVTYVNSRAKEILKAHGIKAVYMDTAGTMK